MDIHNDREFSKRRFPKVLKRHASGKINCPINAFWEVINGLISMVCPCSEPARYFRTEGREFTSYRCLVLTDGFYEFTDPDVPPPKEKRLDKWLFTLSDHRWFCMAGIWRESADGEAFTLLTMDAGADIAPYHHRQIIPLARDSWADWLDPAAPTSEVLRHLPKGSLSPLRVYPPPAELPQGTLAL